MNTLTDDYDDSDPFADAPDYVQLNAAECTDHLELADRVGAAWENLGEALGFLALDSDDERQLRAKLEDIRSQLERETIFPPSVLKWIEHDERMQDEYEGQMDAMSY